MKKARMTGAVLATAVALAFTGSVVIAAETSTKTRTLWYLMAPPQTSQNGHALEGSDLNGSLVKWGKKSFFANEVDCQKARSADWSASRGMVDEQCVADSDPRLKEH